MKGQRGNTPEILGRAHSIAKPRRRFILAITLAACCLPSRVALSQGNSSGPNEPIAIHGTIVDASRHAVGDATVRLNENDGPIRLETKSDAAGTFDFSVARTGRYVLRAEKSGLQSRATELLVQPQAVQHSINLVLEAADKSDPQSKAESPTSAEAMEFADAPKFTVAGVTDWTAAGGHGSDVILRTSETLTRDTAALKPEGGASVRTVSGAGADVNEDEGKLRAALVANPGHFETNHRLGEFYLKKGKFREAVPLLQSAYQIDPANYDNEHGLAIALKSAGDLSQARDHVQRLLMHQERADLHRLAGEVDEGLGDPLVAVREFEKAVRLEASEQNYFEWGSELLLHRAVWQAQEVFKRGTDAYPGSVRMLTALGTALFAGAKYEDAAQRLCQAADLNPVEPEPYIFLGKIELAAPSPLPCVEHKLARFAESHPENSLANYFYAMAILKRQKEPADPQDLRTVEALLNRAVAIDSKCAEAYLQLGILQSLQRNFGEAIAFYSKAIGANSELGDAHYRLGVAYDRMGDHIKAEQEFRRHDELEKKQAEEVERQRREVKQFMVVLEEHPGHPLTH